MDKFSRYKEGIKSPEKIVRESKGRSSNEKSARGARLGNPVTRRLLDLLWNRTSCKSKPQLLPHILLLRHRRSSFTPFQRSGIYVSLAPAPWFELLLERGFCLSLNRLLVDAISHRPSSSLADCLSAATRSIPVAFTQIMPPVNSPSVSCHYSLWPSIHVDCSCVSRTSGRSPL